MLNQELRSQFSIMLYSHKVELSQVLRGELYERGYEVFAFIDQELALNRIAEAAPHIVIFELSSLEDPLHVFVEKVLQLNPEIQFICIAPHVELDALKEFQDFNFTAVINHEENIPLRVAWVVEECCQSLYRLYQVEALNQENLSLQNRISELKNEIVETEVRASQVPQELSIRERYQLFSKVFSKEDSVQVFFNHISGSGVFFKFLPTVNSFVSTLSKGIDLDKLKGVGCRLKPEEVQKLDGILNANQLPDALKDLIENGLKLNRYTLHPLFVAQGLDGLVVLWDQHPSQLTTHENLFILMALKYQELHLLKRVEAFDIYDSVTELYNRNYFLQKLDEEVSRSKRILKAVSVLQIQVDHSEETILKLSPSEKDLLLRTMGSMIRKTSRINDIACSWGDGKFAIILAHCARKGAALRAERLRRIIEGHHFPMSDKKITVSIGVSEYPMLSYNAKDLDESSLKALEFIQSRGGNKVCLYKPPENFKPDFEVAPV